MGHAAVGSDNEGLTPIFQPYLGYICGVWQFKPFMSSGGGAPAHSDVNEAEAAALPQADWEAPRELIVAEE